MDLHLGSTLLLNNGVEMPRFGLGTARMTDPQVVSYAIRYALQQGYRLVDTSKNYENEEWVGQGIRESGISEDQIFLTTKLEGEDYGRETAKREGFGGSLRRLGLNKIDLYLIHAPERDAQLRLETWEALLELAQGEQCRSVGVSNYEIHHLQELLNRECTPPAVNQIELTPFNYSQQRRLVDFCHDHAIHLMAYAPLGVGKALEDTRVVEMARRYQKTPAQLLLRWGVQHDFIVIPKADQEDHIRENAAIFDFEIDPGDMQAMDTW